MIFVGEKLLAKDARKHFGQIWGNSEKYLSHSETFACCYTYAV